MSIIYYENDLIHLVYPNSSVMLYIIRDFSRARNRQICLLFAAGDWQAVTLMTSTLSYDARAVEEDEVAEFMSVLQSYLQNPATLMLPPQSKLRIAQLQS